MIEVKYGSQCCSAGCSVGCVVVFYKKKKNLYHSAICCLKYRDVPKAEYLDNDFKVNNRFKQRESIC